MPEIFLWGPFVALASLGRDTPRTAQLPGFYLDPTLSLPTLEPHAGGNVEGFLAHGKQHKAAEFTASVLGWERSELAVESNGTLVDALVFMPSPKDLSDAVTHLPGDFWTQLIALISAAADHEDARQMRAALPQIKAHAAARARAQDSDTSDPATKTTGRRRVDVLEQSWPYRNFFAATEQIVPFERFDGTLSAPVNRAAFVMADAVTVLPYDPRRDRVLLVEQFRFGPFIRGDANAWTLEPIAGRIDPGETPMQAAHREAREEAGLEISYLEEIARYYPSPGAVTEHLTSYIGLADLPDSVARIAGMAAEAEDIKGHIMDFDAFAAFLTSDAASNGPLILTGYWLIAHRARLRELA